MSFVLLQIAAASAGIYAQVLITAPPRRAIGWAIVANSLALVINVWAGLWLLLAQNAASYAALGFALRRAPPERARATPPASPGAAGRNIPWSRAA